MEYATCDCGGKHEAPSMNHCDALRCVCGNTGSAEGFFPVTTAGRDIDADDTAALQCDRCGRIISMTTGKVLRRV